MTFEPNSDHTRTKLPIFSQASFFRDSKNVFRHSHPATELILATRGEWEVNLPNSTLLVEEGSLLVVAPETEHNQVNHGPVETLFVVFSASPEAFNSATRLIAAKADPWIARLMQLICDLSRATRYELCAGVIHSLLQRITWLEQEGPEGEELHPALKVAIAYIEKHFADAFSLDDVARYAKVSKSHLKNLFIQEMGYAPMQFIQNCRMSHARQLLLNSYLAVSDVAQACGYDDANYFSRAFRKIHQCTPSHYREVVRTRPETAAEFIRL